MHGSPHAAVAHFSAMNMPLSDPLENLDADALRAVYAEALARGRSLQTLPSPRDPA